MSKQVKDIVIVEKDLIQKGIERYEGKVDLHLQNVISAAGLEFKPYTFNDGRILLVMKDESMAFLYKSEEILYRKFSLV